MKWSKEEQEEYLVMYKTAKQEAAVFREMLAKQGIETTRDVKIGKNFIVLRALISPWLWYGFLNTQEIERHLASITQRWVILDGWVLQKRWFRRYRVMNIWLYRENPKRVE